MTNFLFGKIDLSSIGPSWSILESKGNITILDKESKIEIKKYRAINILTHFCDGKYLIILKEKIEVEKSNSKITWKKISNIEKKKLEENLKKNEFDYFFIEIDTKNKGIKLNAGMYQNVGLYYSIIENHLVFSCDISEIFPFLKKPVLLNNSHIAMIMFQDWRYSECTVLKDIFLLTERSTILFKNGKVTKKFPEPFLKINKPTKILTEKEAIIEFEEIFTDHLKKRYSLFSDLHFGTELSGGLDSSIVALLFKKTLKFELQGFSMILPDNQSILQKKRIKEFSNIFGIGINLSDTKDYYPLKANGLLTTRQYHYIFDELYCEALYNNLDLAKKKNIDIMFTGIGGDELFEFPEYNNAVYSENYSIEQKSISPNFGNIFTTSFYNITKENYIGKSYKPILPESLIDANIIRSKSFLDHNIYPVSAFANTELFEFMIKVPNSLIQKRKELFKKIHAKNGSPKIIYQVKKPDSFAPLCDIGIKEKGYHIIKKVFQNSIMSELNIINKKEFLNFYETFVKSKEKIDGGYICILIIELEFMLQTLNNKDAFDKILRENTF